MSTLLIGVAIVVVFVVVFGWSLAVAAGRADALAQAALREEAEAEVADLIEFGTGGGWSNSATP